MKPARYSAFIIGLGFACTQSGTSFAGEGKQLSLQDVLDQVGKKLGISEAGTQITERGNDSLKLESRIFGDTALEFEGERPQKNQKDGVYQLVVSQPIHFGAKSDALRQSVEYERQSLASEFRTVHFEAAREVANALLALESEKSSKKIWQGVVDFYGKLSADLSRSTAKGQTGELVNRQVAEKLRMANHHVLQAEGAIKDLQVVLAAWGYSPEQDLPLQVRTYDQGVRDALLQKVDNFPSVAQYRNQAAASSAKASYVSGSFEVEMGLGAQSEAGSDSRSYLLRLSAPIGQLHSRRQSAKVLLHDKALYESKAKIQAHLATQKLRELFSQLGREETHIVSHQTGQKEAESIFALAKSGFDRGILSFNELRDLFDHMVESQIDVNDAKKRIQSLRLDIFFLAGGSL